MKKTFKEKFLSRCSRFIKKYPFMTKPTQLYMMVVLFFYYSVIKIGNNSKRLASLAVVFLLFFVSSSFSFPTSANSSIENVDNKNLVTINEEALPTDESISLVDDQGVSLEDIDIVDDEDVLEGYEDAELHGMDQVDKYSSDEILQENESFAETQEENSDDVMNSQDIFDKDDWKLVLINKQHPIPEDYTFTLGTIKSGMQCDERIINDVLDMLKAAKEDGVNLVICSPYRDMNRQDMLFNRKIKIYMSKGMSYMDAYKLASQAVTVPGASEHQIGLALDIVCDRYSSLDEGFGDTDAGKWLYAHSSEYGFILRYPAGKEYITGIEYEPWHFRYVGVDAATIIMGQNLTLEEFVDNL